MANWYYVDASGQQVGPLSEEDIRSAVQRGSATMASLAWRDGLAAWQPISQLANELGLSAATSAATTVVSRPSPAADNPYRAPESESGESGFANTGEVVYAGFWRRWAALFLDQLIIGVPLFVVFFGVAFAVAMSSGGEPNPVVAIIMQLGFYAVWLAAALFYYAGLESSEAQATFGKRALGIKVTDLQGQRISFRHAVGRWAAASISYMSMYIGFAMAGFTERKQALHDLMASTLVVDRWAYTRYPDRQQRGMGGCLIVFIVFVAGGLIMIPILAVVAVSQFQEFQRHQVGALYPVPPAVTVCEAPASSTYVARCRPPSFDA